MLKRSINLYRKLHFTFLRRLISESKRILKIKFYILQFESASRVEGQKKQPKMRDSSKVPGGLVPVVPCLCPFSSLTSPSVACVSLLMLHFLLLSIILLCHRVELNRLEEVWICPTACLTINPVHIQVSSNLCKTPRNHLDSFCRHDLTPSTMTSINKNSDIVHICSKALKLDWKVLQYGH